MLEYNVLLKGLKPGEDVYESIHLVITGDTEEEVDAFITDAIYQVRLDSLYYKMKYISKDRIQ